MANRKTRKIKNSVPIQQNSVSSDKTENRNSSIQTITTETDYYRPIILAIEQSSEGDFIFVEANTPVERKNFPLKVKNYGLKNVIYYININNDLPSSLPLYKSIPKWLKERKIPANQIIIALDGFEGIFRDEDFAKKWLQTFNLSREALANVKVILTFLIPAFGIDLIRQYSPDIWSWRAFHFQLPSKEKSEIAEGILRSGLGETVPIGDNPEKREARVKVLSGLLDEELKLHGSIEAVWRNILSPLVNELSESARYNEALEVLSKAKQWINSSPNTRDSAEYFNSLGSIYYQLGNTDIAEKYLHNALDISEKIYGKEHSYVATGLNNIGLVLWAKGDLEGALEYLKRALEIGEKVYGQEHPNVATGLNNIGLVLKDKGDLDGALEYAKRALEIDEKVYGQEHPNVAGDLNNIGLVLMDKGDLDRALEYLKRALEINEKVYGQEHPNVAINLNNIGMVLQDKGNLDGALEYLKSALEINEKVYGQEHPEVATGLNNIGMVLQDKGDLEEARKFFKRAFLILINAWGLENPKTKLVLDNYVGCGGNPDELLALAKKEKKPTFPNKS